MDEDVFRLKNSVPEAVLKYLANTLTNRGTRIEMAIRNYPEGVLSLEQVKEWIAAIESGKRIENPLSPREEIRAIINKYYPEEGKFLITAHDYQILLFYARKAVKEGEVDD
jgi:hypothetical protein